MIVFVKLQSLSTLNSEMIIASAGIIWITRIITMKALRPRKRNRETATAATKAITRAHPTTISVTIRLLRTASQKKSRLKALR